MGRPQASSWGRKAEPGASGRARSGSASKSGHRPAAAQDLAVADALPGDGRRGLDLLDDGTVGRARHQEEKQRVGAGQRALGEEDARGLLLRVRVGDVEPHAARARGADLEVGARLRLDHGLVQDLDVPDELGQGVRDQQGLQALAQVAAVLQGLVGVAARLVDVLVGDAGRGVHGVHDDVGPPLGDELVQVVLRRRRRRRAGR